MLHLYYALIYIYIYESVDELLLLLFPHFTDPIMTGNAQRDVVHVYVHRY